MSDNFIVLASDHGGFELKEYLKKKLIKAGYNVIDFGTESGESVDYPDVIYKAAKSISNGTYKKGVFMCGTGIGASIVANKVKSIRAALVYTKDLAILSKTHNNANVIVFGGRFIGFRKAFSLLKIWLKTPFSNDSRHVRRIEKILEVEKNECIE